MFFPKDEDHVSYVSPIELADAIKKDGKVRFRISTAAARERISECVICFGPEDVLHMVSGLAPKLEMELEVLQNVRSALLDDLDDNAKLGKIRSIAFGQPRSISQTD